MKYFKPLLKKSKLPWDKKMQTKILYATKGGNTKKVALALQEELKTEIFDLNSIDPTTATNFWVKNPADIYFIGTGIYADHIEGRIREFFIANHPPKDTKFAFFATWIGRGNSGPDTLDKFRHFLEKYESKVITPYFLCYGKMAFIRKEHPNSKDCEDIKNWGRKLAN